MKCIHDIVLISRYLEKELTAKQMHEVEAHLKQCRACRKELARLQTAMTIMKSVQEVEIPRDYAESARRKLNG